MNYLLDCTANATADDIDFSALSISKKLKSLQSRNGSTPDFLLNLS